MANTKTPRKRGFLLSDRLPACPGRSGKAAINCRQRFSCPARSASAGIDYVTCCQQIGNLVSALCSLLPDTA